MDINLLRRLSRLAPPNSYGFDQPPDESPNRAGILALSGQPQEPQNPLAQLANPAVQGANPMGDYPTPILDQYGAFLKNAPDINNFKPSKGRRLMAGLASLDDRVRDPQAASEAINYAPYNRQMGDYYTKAKLLGEGANVEEKQIANKRQIAYSEARMDLQNRLADLKAEHEALLRTKSDQINEVAWAKLQQSYDKLAQDLKIAQDKLANTATNQDEVNRLRQMTIEALNARHALDIAVANRRADIAEQNANTNAERTDIYGRRVDQLGQPIQSTEEIFDTKGKSQGKKITIRSRGNVQQAAPSSYVNPNSPGAVIVMIGPDGKDYQVPQDKVEETLKIPGWKVKR